jgi:hypothetical protein
MRLSSRDRHLIENKIDQISIDIVRLNKNQVRQLIHPKIFQMINQTKNNLRN